MTAPASSGLLLGDSIKATMLCWASWPSSYGSWRVFFFVLLSSCCSLILCGSHRAVCDSLFKRPPLLLCKADVFQQVEHSLNRGQVFVLGPQRLQLLLERIGERRLPLLLRLRCR